MSDSALSDLRVLEYSHFISGPYCGKLLADLGAEVIKVEEPGIGDEARRTAPFLNDTPHLERSGLFLYLNTNKLGVTVNLRSSKGRSIFKDLVKECDILIENNRPDLMTEFGLDYQTLSQINAQLIMTSITPFGQTGPYREYRATDLITCQMAGLGWTTPGKVRNPPQEPPLRTGGGQAHFVAGSTAAMATLFALCARRASGVGQHLDISEQEALASFLRMEIAYYTHDPDGSYHMFKTRVGTPIMVGFLPCKDGYIVNGCREEYQWRRLLEVVFGPDFDKEKRLMNIFEGAPWSVFLIAFNWEKVRPLIVEWTMQHTKEEIFRIAQQRNLPITPCNTIDEVLASPQIKERGFFIDIDHPETGKIHYPGAPYKLEKTPCQVVHPAPLLGQHNNEIFAGRLGYSKQDLAKLSDSGVI
jgi:CoA:oxalate CoA-transferase